MHKTNENYNRTVAWWLGELNSVRSPERSAARSAPKRMVVNLSHALSLSPLPPPSPVRQATSRPRRILITQFKILIHPFPLLKV